MDGALTIHSLAAPDPFCYYLILNGMDNVFEIERGGTPPAVEQK
jgi:hypothetical protein